jgi:hypothetical protein
MGPPVDYMRHFRVAVTPAKQRLMTAHFDYYELAHSEEGVGSGFRYKTILHITLKSIEKPESGGLVRYWRRVQLFRSPDESPLRLHHYVE